MATKKTLKDKISNLKNKDKYVICLSVLNSSGDIIDHYVESHNFVTNDLPSTRNEISKLLFQLHKQEVASKTNTELQQEVQESNIKGQLE